MTGRFAPVSPAECSCPKTPMQTRIPETDQELQQLFAEVSELRRFAGPPDQFWPRFLAAAGRLVAASRANIILRHPGEPPRLGKIGARGGDEAAGGGEE